MSTVLTKPVLLDETGQAIVGKLDEIKEAIDNGGTEKYPVLIHITSMPSKTSYIAGEQLNLAGMVVKAVFSNNVEYDVTDQCTFSPANGTVLTSSDTSVTATYTWHPTGTSFTATQAITVKGIVGISVATPPTKTDYIINETLDLTGMVVHLNYDDSTYDDITADCTYVPANGATLDDDTLTAVAISYYEPSLATTLTTSQAISVVIPIYGVEWDGTATSVLSRTDLATDFADPIPCRYYQGAYEGGSSPFDTISPWKDIEIVEDSGAGTLVKIPKFYYKWTKSGTTMKLQISPMKIDATWNTSPAHMDRGDGYGERDFVYVARYKSVASTLKSVTGSSPVTSLPVQSVWGGSYLANMGADVHLWDFSMYWTICMLYLVEFADWDSQKTIGYGGTGGIGISTNGQTDAMPYHTGVYASSAQYRHIENLWSSGADYVNGIIVNNMSLMCTNDFSKQNAASTYGVTLATVSAMDGFIKAFGIPNQSGYEYALYPAEATSSPQDASADYVNDTAYFYQTSSEFIVSVGAAWSAAEGWKAHGLFHIQGRSVSSATIDWLTYRIMKAPNT